MPTPTGSRIDVTLVAGGKYHDIDYARLERGSHTRSKKNPGNRSRKGG